MPRCGKKEGKEVLHMLEQRLPEALGETIWEQVCTERLQFVDRIHVGEVREGIAAD